MSTSSPIEKLNAAIQSHNPFVEKGAIARVNDIWGKGFPDVPTLNAHASDAVFKTIKQVSSSQSKVASLAIIAERGVGKTHLFGRIRHRCQADGSALFIYASATRFTHLDLIKYQLLQVVSDSLNQIGSQGVKQWQELATAMLNVATKTQTLPQEMIEKKFPYALSKNKNLLDNLTGAVLKSNSDCDPDIVRAILWTLSQENASYAIKWLSGNDLAEAKAADLGLPNLDKEEREAKAFETVRQIFSLCSDYKSVIICFDELEAVNIENGGFPRPQAVAELVKTLFDSLYLSNNSRGVVILTVMMPDTWKLTIKKLPGGIPDRVSSVTAEPIELLAIDGNSIIQLVTLWLQEFYGSKNLVPHSSFYPFTESQLRELGKQKPTVRQVLHWCAKNFQLLGTLSNSENKPKLEEISSDPVAAALSKEMGSVEGDMATLMEDKAIVADALRVGFQTLIGQTIENFKIERLQEIEPRKENSGWIDFKIVGKENGRTVKIGVAVVQHSNASGVLAGLRRLVAFKTFGMDRSCLIRGREINSGAIQTQEYLKKFLSSKKGEWVPLKLNDIKFLLAIRYLYLKREDHNLSEQQIKEFIEQNKVVIGNYLICKILSKPTGIIPDLGKEVDTLPGAKNPNPDPTIVNPDSEQNLNWINDIVDLGNRSKETDAVKSNYQAGTDFENIVRRSLKFLGFTVEEAYKGGAGGLDLFCSKPYPLLGECKAGKSIPGNTVYELDKLGDVHLENNYLATAVKLIIGPGQPTSQLQTVAEKRKISIISPLALEKLVKLQASCHGSVNLIELKAYLEAGQIDSKIEEYVQTVKKNIEMRSHIVQLVKKHLETTNFENAGIEGLHGAYVHSNPPKSLQPKEMHEILIELSSPLAGYLGREKGSDWRSDRFYYLRDLIVEEEKK